MEHTEDAIEWITDCLKAALIDLLANGPNEDDEQRVRDHIAEAHMMYDELSYEETEEDQRGKTTDATHGAPQATASHQAPVASTSPISRLSEDREAHAEKCVKACAGLPAGALDGGWTAAGMNAYAKSLEDLVAHLRKELRETLKDR